MSTPAPQLPSQPIATGAASPTYMAQPQPPAPMTLQHHQYPATAYGAPPGWESMMMPTMVSMHPMASQYGLLTGMGTMGTMGTMGGMQPMGGMASYSMASQVK